MPFLDPSSDVQKAIYSRLTASPDLMALVPVANVSGSNSRPEALPCVNIGEASSTFRRFDATSFATIHIWFAEPGYDNAKAAASAIVNALRVDAQIDGVLLTDNFVVHDMAVTRTQFMRDIHAEYSHAILSVAAIVTAK
jgi:hypothetical protein